MRCQGCGGQLRKTDSIPLRRRKRYPADDGKGLARPCPKCRMLHWEGNRVRVMSIVDDEGNELSGPFYLVNGKVEKKVSK